jgi:hypothetical protein
MHDRFIDDPELLLDDGIEKNNNSGSNQKIGRMDSAHTTYMVKDRSETNIFHGNKKKY